MAALITENNTTIGAVVRMATKVPIDELGGRLASESLRLKAAIESGSIHDQAVVGILVATLTNRWLTEILHVSMDVREVIPC